jgi:hypothetical protein
MPAVHNTAVNNALWCLKATMEKNKIKNKNTQLVKKKRTQVVF